MQGDVGMNDYPAMEGLTQREKLTCQFLGCGRDSRKYKGLLKHIRMFHLVEADELRRHWLHFDGLRERRRTKAITPLEMEYVGLCYDAQGDVDEECFMCKGCDPRRRLLKRSCSRHMLGQHPLTSEVVRKWLCHSDGLKVKNKSSRHGGSWEGRLLLTKAVLQYGIWGGPPSPLEPDSVSDGFCSEFTQFSDETPREREPSHVDRERDLDEADEPPGGFWRHALVRVDAEGRAKKPLQLEWRDPPLQYAGAVLPLNAPEESPPHFREPARVGMEATAGDLRGGAEIDAAQPLLPTAPTMDEGEAPPAVEPSPGGLPQRRVDQTSAAQDIQVVMDRLVEELVRERQALNGPLATPRPPASPDAPEATQSNFSVALTHRALDWHLTSDTEQARRAWPLPSNKVVDLKEYEQYLRRTKRHEPGTVNGYMKSMRQFFWHVPAAQRTILACGFFHRVRAQWRG